jgi:hypothetical protein
MSVTENPNADRPGPALPPVRRRRWLVWVLMLVVFISGVGIGGAGALLVARNRLLLLIQHPELAMPELATQLGYRLGLSADQVRQVEKILLTRGRNIDAIRQEIRPRVNGELDKLEQDVAEILNAQQRGQWHDLCAHLRRTWMPPAR